MPQERILRGKKASQQFLVLGRYADDRERDLTGRPASRFRIPLRPRGCSRAACLRWPMEQTVVTASVGGFSARASLKIEDSNLERPFSFPRDIVSIFTRRGCNTAGCHGGIKGQAGFKLSTHGIHPKEDHKWIVEGGVFQVLTDESSGAKNPRIDVKNPEQSLILQKATMGIPHGGGVRFQKGSEDYEAILNWVRNGAPYGAEDKESNPESGAARGVSAGRFPARRRNASAPGDGLLRERQGGGLHAPGAV